MIDFLPKFPGHFKDSWQRLNGKIPGIFFFSAAKKG